MVTDYPHSGTYCAYNMYDNWIRQDFDPVNVDDIISITLWYREPSALLFAYDLFYGSSDYDRDIFCLSGSDWEEFDITNFLRPSGDLTGIRLWGYSGGGGDNISYLDDVSIIYEDYTGVQNSSLGIIRALFN